MKRTKLGGNGETRLTFSCPVSAMLLVSAMFGGSLSSAIRMEEVCSIFKESMKNGSMANMTRQIKFEINVKSGFSCLCYPL